MASHRERLVAPLSWWIAAVAFAVVCGWIVLVATRWPIGIAAAVVVGVLSAGTLWRYGDVVISAGPDGFRAGRAHLALEHVGTVEALGVKAFRERLGPTADARAWLVTRPYILTGIVVTVDDPADRTPYWLVSARAPERLVAAIEAVRQTGPTPATGGASHGEQEEG
ncbi:MAG: DUF3093 domain-containing protein [Actinomycetales bacterium]|nr:MAG: DUF3093 domain-containing protein [Actinomycetales bacterium]